MISLPGALQPDMKDGHTNDKHLAERLLAGDEDAFEELFAVQVPRLYRIALARLDNDAAAAEDAVQATLIKAMQKLSTFRGEASLLTWLATICLREIGAAFRKSQRRPELQLNEDVPEISAALELLETVGDGPEQSTLRNEVSRLVQATLDRLPARYADVLEWKYFEGLSVKEIAARLDTGPTAVQSVLSRARVAFRDGFITVGACADLTALARRTQEADHERESTHS